MGAENVALVRDAIELFNRGAIDELFEGYLADDIECDYTRSAAPDLRGVFRGHDGTRRLIDGLTEPWEKVELVAEEYLDAGGDVVVVKSHTRNVGRGGIEVVARGAMLFEVRNGKLTLWRLYQSKDEALEAVSDSS